MEIKQKYSWGLLKNYKFSAYCLGEGKQHTLKAKERKSCMDTETCAR